MEELPLDHFCEAPHCMRPAGHKAPKSRTNIEEYSWFCEEHIREYNAHWDYLKGLSPKEIEEEIRADILWRRPSWHKGNTFKTGDFGGREDVFELFQKHEEKRSQAKYQETLPEEVLKALQVMKLSFPITIEELKRTYKEQVKKYHPDVNGGAKEAEEIIKSVNIAFRIIENFLGHARS